MSFCKQSRRPFGRKSKFHTNCLEVSWPIAKKRAAGGKNLSLAGVRGGGSFNATKTYLGQTVKGKLGMFS